MRIDHDPLSASVIGVAIEVHRNLGPSLFESAYEECLAWELEARGVPARRQVAIPVVYKGVPLDVSYRVDLLVSESLVVEVKSVEHLTSVHDAQVLTYMKMSGARVGLLLNFNTPVLRDGIRRFSARWEAERTAASADGGTATAGDGGTAPPRHREQPRRVSAFTRAEKLGARGRNDLTALTPKQFESCSTGIPRSRPTLRALRGSREIFPPLQPQLQQLLNMSHGVTETAWARKAWGTGPKQHGGKPAR